MKKNEPLVQIRALPALRIEVSELLQILERVSAGKFKITAETTDAQFESVDEMKSHMAEFAHATKINVGPVGIETGNQYSLPRLYVSFHGMRSGAEPTAVDEAKLLLQALEKELLPYKSKMANPKFRNLATLLFTIICTALVLASFSFQDAGSASWPWLSISLVPLLFTDPAMKWLVGVSTVSFQPRETWFQRHSSELIVGIVTALAGAGASYYLTQLLIVCG
jgi:hypothetical protein